MWKLGGSVPLLLAGAVVEEKGFMAPMSLVKVSNFSWVHLSFCSAGHSWPALSFHCLGCWILFLFFVTKYFVTHLYSEHG